jgi:hypothetical protein
MNFTGFRKNPYKLINLILAIIIFGVFTYSAVFSPSKSNYPIPSDSKRIFNQDSISTGLSRSFSCILRLDFKKAREYNKYGLQIFVFFLIQFFLRLFFLLSYNAFKEFGITKMILVDSIVSVSLFIFYFKPFLIEFIYF